MNKKGFTLTELLVTISILGIVTLLSIPLISAIRDANLKRKYNAYLDTITYNAKLYVDSYQDDLFKYQDSGCAYINYSDLKEKLLTRDIEVDNISCNTDETFVQVTKLYDLYKYNSTIGCGKKENDGSVNIDINYPTKLLKDSTCGPDVEKRMTVDMSPNSYSGNKKKKVTMKVTVSSFTGFNTQSQISYGFYKVDSSHLKDDYRNVTEWKSLTFNIPSTEKQKEMYQNLGPGEKMQITSNDIVTPNGVTGEYQLVLRVDFLTDLAGINWRNDDVSDYIYSNLYKVDNTPPTISSFILTSGNSNYRDLTPKRSITATDNNNYTKNEDLLACYSKDSDSCSKKVSDIKSYSKLSTINNTKAPKLVNDYDSSNHTLYITVADLAGNYTTVSKHYEVAQRYRINYNSNGGNNCSPTYKDDVIYNRESPGKWGDLCSPTRNYYTFEGWNRKADGSGAKVTKDTVVSYSEKTITVYAQWKPITYTITYNLNGGSVSGNPTTYNVETATFTLKNPTKTGYDFEGWTGTGLSGKTKTVTIPKGSHDNRSYTANWKVHNYTISYTLNGGSVSGNPTTYTIETADFTLKNPTRTGYTFTGWTGSNGTTPQTSVTIKKGSTGNKTYTANWKVITYTISYTLNGGSVSGNPTTYTIESADFTLKNPTRTGYTFTGWTGSNGTTPQTSVTIKKGSYGNKTYTANWKTVSYTISYTLNGGSVSGNPTSYTIESADFTLKNPTRTGYTFTGWTGSNGTTTQTSVTIKKGSTGNKTYTANWKIITYTISYTLNSGSVSGNPTSYNVETADFTLKNPTRTGYTFTGWTGTNGTTTQTSVTIKKGSTGNRSYTANWKIISVSCNGGQYLAKNSTSCSGCPAGSYCPGGTYSYNTSGDQGKIACAIGSYSTANSSTCAACTGKTTTAAGQSSCNANCSNNYGIGSWTTASWSANSVSNLCKINTCASGYSLSNNTCTRNNYSISYTLNGGSVSGNPTSYNVETASFTLKSPTRTEYIFTGWTGSNGSTPQTNVTISKGSTGNKSYTANWKCNDTTKPTVTNVSVVLNSANSATVSFNANDTGCSGMKHYVVEFGGKTITTTSKSVQFTNLSTQARYTPKVTAYDNNNNSSSETGNNICVPTNFFLSNKSYSIGESVYYLCDNWAVMNNNTNDVLLIRTTPMVKSNLDSANISSLGTALFMSCGDTDCKMSHCAWSETNPNSNMCWIKGNRPTGEYDFDHYVEYSWDKSYIRLVINSYLGKNDMLVYARNVGALNRVYGSDYVRVATSSEVANSNSSYWRSKLNSTSMKWTMTKMAGDNAESVLIAGYQWYNIYGYGNSPASVFPVINAKKK